MAKCLQDASAYTVAWITTLEIERAAATAQLDEPHEEPQGFEQHQSDHNSYDWGRIGKHNVVIASLPSGQMGTGPAAFTVSNLLASLPWIRFGLFVGIGGGIPRLPHRDIRLGDVVISQPTKTTGGVVQYDKSAAVSGGKRQLRSVLNSPPTVLLHALSAMKAKHEEEIPQVVGFLEEMKKNRPRMIERGYIHQGFENDKLYSSSYEHVGGATCIECDTSYTIERTKRTTTEPGIHYGLIASGNTLFKDAAARAELESLVGEEEGCLCVEMEAAGIVNNFPCIVIRGICSYADSHNNDRWQRYASATAAVYTKELLSYVHAQKLMRTKPLWETMEKSIQKIQEGVKRVGSKVEDLTKSTNTAELRKAIDRLPSVVGASFDSAEESYNRKCLPGTRVELLDMVQAWAEDPEGHSVLWLHGAAGSGKSTISRSVCERLTKRKRSNYLGASFFFKRGGGDRGSMRKFFTTMASQLARSQPRLARYMKEALYVGSDVADMEPRLQFEKLIKAPLEKDAKDNPTSKQPRLLPVFVVDGLDECIGSNETGLEGSVRRLIRIFLDSRKVGLKVFLTSRPELPMRLEFRARQGEYHDLALLGVPKQLVKRDISIFLRHQFSLIKDDWNRLAEGNPLPQHWPSEDDFKSLLGMAVPLFIIASTVCIFIGDFQFGSPKRQLRDILKSGTRVYGLPLADVYTPMLRSILHKDSPEQHVMHLKRFHDIIGPLILLETPQSMSTLANLLGLELDYIEAHFKRYHSVLYVPSSMKFPVRLLHLSFKHFLLRKESHDKNIQVDDGSVHGTLAERCSRVMAQSLTKDICNVRWPGTLRTSVPSKRVERCIPSEVRYACIYWAHHLQQAKSPIDGDCVYQFLQKYLLYWTEALVYLGKIGGLPQMLEDLKTLATRQGQLIENLRKLLDEGIHWIRHYLPIIEMNPLQIYASALVFTPTTSLIQRTFQQDLPNWITTQPHCDQVWDTQLLQRLSSQADWNWTSLEFSQDGTLFAAVGYESAKKEYSCRFWLVRTGEILHDLSLGKDFFIM